MTDSHLRVTPGDHYLAFVLDETSRRRVRLKCLAMFDIVTCDHVTIAYDFNQEDCDKLQKLVDRHPHVEVTEWIRADGIDLFRVSVNGEVQRPCGGLYHLTLSKNRVRQSSDSNRVLSGEISTRDAKPTLIQLSGEFKLIPKR